jgi:CIC family chloride channel protein
LVGLLGASVAVAFRALTHGLTSLLTGEENIVEAARSLPVPWLILLPALGGLVGGFIARRFVRTGGTMGIAQIMEVVAVGKRTVKVRQSAARTASSLIVIATGGSEGREGPIIQMAAAFASGVARLVKVSQERAQILVACGMAAGVAGAYNTPISATLFVIELIVGSFSMSIFGPVVVSAVVSSIVTRAVLGDAPLYHVPTFVVTSARQYLLYAPLGLLAGMGSVFFMRALRLCKRMFHATGWKDEYRMFLGGAGVGLVGLLYADVWGNGFEGTNHVLAAEMSIGALAGLCLAKVVATGLTIGAIVGTAAKLAFPHLDAPVFGCALLGMGGLLAGTTRAPFLAIIMMFELTDAPAIVLPMMIVSVLAIIGARVFERESIYVEELRESGVHWHDTPQGTALTSLRVEEIMRAETALHPPSLSLDGMIDAFMTTRALHLYVGTDDDRLLGVVELHDLQQAMRVGDLSDLVVAGDVMREIPFVLPGDSLASVNEKLWLRDFGHLPVVEDATTRRFLGVVTRRDILGALDREILGRGALMARVSRVSPDGHQTDFLELPENHRLATIDVTPDLEGKTLAQADLRQRHGMLVLAVRRFVPGADEPMRRGDRLIVMAREDRLAEFGVDQPTKA